MKTSKIIFFSVLITIALFILAAFVDIRLNGSKHIDTSELESHKTAIPEFKVLVLHNSVNVSVLQNQTTDLELNIRKGVLPPEINFSVKRDTLIISDVRNLYNNEVVFVKVHANGSLCSILANNSDIRVESPRNGDLSIVTDNSKVFISHNTTSKSDDDLIIHAINNSKISSSTFRIDSLGVFVERSEASLSIQSNVLHGSASGGSVIFTRQPLGISFKCDSTSRFLVNTSIYKY